MSIRLLVAPPPCVAHVPHARQPSLLSAGGGEVENSAGEAELVRFISHLEVRAANHAAASCCCRNDVILVLSPKPARRQTLDPHSWFVRPLFWFPHMLLIASRPGENREGNEQASKR